MTSGENEACVSGCAQGGGRGVVKIVGILVVGAVLIVQILANSTDVFSQSSDSISVVGQGRVPVRPDAALVNLGVTVVKAETTEAAVKEVSEKIAKVNEAVAGLGIPEENRLVTGYAVSPRYAGGAAIDGNTDAVPTLSGYTASQQITVRVPGIDQNKELVNQVIEAAAKEGANQIGEIKFIATNVEAFKQEARLKALEDAETKADRMASTAGVKIEGISSWSDNVIAAPNQGYPNQSYYASGTSDSQVAQGVTPPSGVIVLQPGQLDTIVELNVTFNIEGKHGLSWKKK